MREYEVVFVVYGTIDREDCDIGNVECSGCIPLDNGELYAIKDGRINYFSVANSPEEAYMDCLKRLDEEDFGDLEVEPTALEHVSYNETYWYKSDLNI